MLKRAIIANAVVTNITIVHVSGHSFNIATINVTISAAPAE